MKVPIPLLHVTRCDPTIRAAMPTEAGPIRFVQEDSSELYEKRATESIDSAARMISSLVDDVAQLLPGVYRALPKPSIG